MVLFFNFSIERSASEGNAYDIRCHKPRISPKHTFKTTACGCIHAICAVVGIVSALQFECFNFPSHALAVFFDDDADRFHFISNTLQKSRRGNTFAVTVCAANRQGFKASGNTTKSKQKREHNTALCCLLRLKRNITPENPYAYHPTSSRSVSATSSPLNRTG